MHRLISLSGVIFSFAAFLAADEPKPVSFEIPEPPALVDFEPLPPEDAAFSAQLAEIVETVGLAGTTPAADNPDDEDEWSSICVVDLSDSEAGPRVAGWKADNMIYPASTYKMYALGEAIRQVVEGEISLDDKVVVKEHNVRGGSRPVAGQEMSVSEVLRLTIQYSDNTAANETIDLVDRRRASALMRALGCEGSEITRKYLPRDREDEGFAEVRGTETCALHAATFLWAVESGAIGGGRGRGLIKSYLAMEEKGMTRFKGGLPASATVFSKTGWWNIFTSEAGLIEDGETRFILAAFTAETAETAVPKLADLAGRVHALLSEGPAASEAASESPAEAAADQ